MCGRFGLSRPDKLDLRRFGIESFPSQPPRYNISPGTDVLTVRVRRTGRVADLLRWGLVPHWAKDPSIGHRMANVRADTALTKPGFRDAMQRRRCLLPADVFYEWQVVPGQKAKQPYAVARPDRDFLALGAIWDYWKPRDADADSDGLITCAILTTEPNSLLQPIHDRMPVIVPPAAYSAWLDSRTPEPALRELLRPLPAEQLEAWAISTRVNRAAEEGADLLDPMSGEAPPAN
jgi:putative SOS response-associated peptidase YedK